MKWVTRSYLYLDRVASAWLIRRFVDAAAEFSFVGWEPGVAVPAGVHAFALPHGELSEHDERGTTFEKIVATYDLHDPSLHRLGKIIALAVTFTQRRELPQLAEPDAQFAATLVMLSEGMLLVELEDHNVLERSMPIYDALYRSLRVHALMTERGETIPTSDGRGPGVRTEYMRRLWEAAAHEAR